jgi:hypothetical protein
MNQYKHLLAKLTLLAVLLTGAQAPLWSQDQATKSNTTATSAYENDQLPSDVRLQPLKDLDGYFPFDPPATLPEWNQRAPRVRTQLMVATGIYPQPEKTPLNPVIHGKVEQEDYTVERVFFESVPGFYVTGSLYRPKNLGDKKAPGILCPHGHWANGRFYDAGDAAAKKEIEIGAEVDEAAAHSPLQARCVHLARMGCVVFHYDMIGYADSVQISFDVAHRFAKQRPEMNRAENWGLFSPQAESHLQSIVGLQSWNSMRSLDFLLTLPEVDPQRLAVTGGSGGGTQTMLLAAIDPRVAAAFPAVMVSTSMQGGCTCENCSLLRVNTGNVEFAALFAPKPQGMSAADDWTKEMQTKGFPQLQQLYGLYGAKDRVHLVSRTEFAHNYNMHTRLAMYQLFNECFALNADVNERPFKRLSTEQLTVWDEAHPKPTGGDAFETKLLAQMHAASEKQVTAWKPMDHNGFLKFHTKMSAAILGLIQRTKEDKETFEWELVQKVRLDDVLLMTGKLKVTSRSEELPMLFFYPDKWNGEVVVWTSEQGKQHLVEASGKPQPEVARLLKAGYSVASVDLFKQGEFLKPGEEFETTGKVANPREAAAYTFGYNNSVFVQRVHDLMSVVKFCGDYEKHPAKKVHLLALDQAGPIAAVARGALQESVDAAAINTHQFRFANVDDIHSANFMPGGAKYLDLPGFLAMSAPNRLWLVGEGDHAKASAGAKLVEQVFRAADAESQLQLGDDASAAKAVDWIMHVAKE